MALLSNAAVLLDKELRTEFRSRELLTTTTVFVLIVIVLFSFSFDPTSEESRRFGAGLLWLAFLFAASLMLQPCFLREQSNDTLSALRLSVSDPFAIFLAKLTANTLFLLLTELLLLPVFAVMYNVPVLPTLHWLVLVFFLDRKSTRLNSSHTVISYAVFCLKKKKGSRSGPCRRASLRPPRSCARPSFISRVSLA